MNNFLKSAAGKIAATIGLVIALTVASFIQPAQAQFRTLVPFNAYIPTNTMPLTIATTGVSNNVIVFQPGPRGFSISGRLVSTNAAATNGVFVSVRPSLDSSLANWGTAIYTTNFTANSTTPVTNIWFVTASTVDNVGACSLTLYNSNAVSVTFSNLTVGTLGN